MTRRNDEIAENGTQQLEAPITLTPDQIEQVAGGYSFKLDGFWIGKLPDPYLTMKSRLEDLVIFDQAVLTVGG